MQIPIEVSARHAHLTPEVIEELFGSYALKQKKELSQPGEFASSQQVTLKTKKGVIERVRVLGPARDYNQIELCQTDAYRLGVNPPVRDSSELNLEGTPGITLIGLKGEVVLEKGLIIPWRHIHLSPNEAIEMGLKDGQLVKVDIDSHPRSLVFENVLVRVSPKYKLSMHIDTDEGNAAGVAREGEGRLLAN